MSNTNSKTWIWILVGLFLFAAVFTKGFGLIGGSGSGSGGSGSGGPANVSSAIDKVVSIPLSEVTSEAKWYEYSAGNKKTKFFVVKASDDTVRTAFDECDVCGRYEKGYRQEGADMVCNNCGNRYPIDGLGTKNRNPGGCWPGYLPSAIKGSNVVIKKSDLEKNL